MLIRSTALHFFVDGLCGAALVALAAYGCPEDEIEKCFMLYTILAFGTQWVIGLIIDRCRHLHGWALWLAFAMLLIGAIGGKGLFFCICLGLGNSIFHVLAGKIVLERFGGFKESGIFVSSGAIGLALGLQQIISLPIMLLGLFLSCYAVWIQLKEHLILAVEYVNYKKLLPFNNLWILLSVSALCICIIFRGFTGVVRLDDLPLWLPCIYVAGKILGGICCDAFGYVKTVLALFLAGFIALQFAGIAPMLIFVLLCNMTMPLTLRIIHYYLPDYAGGAFGLAAFCLLPGWFFKDYSIPLPVIVVVQFILLFAGGYLLFGKELAAEGNEE